MLPQEFLERMENMLGEEYPAFLKSYDIARYQALRLNPQKGDDVSFLNRGVFSLERVPWQSMATITRQRIRLENIRITKPAYIISRSRAPWLRQRI